MPQGSLRSRIALWFGATFFGVVGCILLVLHLRVEAETEAQVAREMRDARAILGYLLRARSETLTARARSMGDLPKIGALLDTNDPLTVQDVAREFPALSHSDYVMLTNARGIVLAHTAQPNRRGENLSGQPGVAAALREETTLETRRVSGRLFQVASAPVRAGGALTGTVHLGFELDDAFVAELRAGSGSHLTLVSGGKLVASTLPPDLRHALREALLALPGASPTTPEAAPPLQKALFGPVRLRMNGEEYLTLAEPLTDAAGERIGLYLIQKSVDEALLPHRNIQRGLLVIGIAGLMLGMLASYLMARSITEPLLRLVQAAEALGRGDWSQRVPTTGSDEIGVLARTFNAMASRLQSWDSDLRAAVAERTAELNQAVVRLDAAYQQMRRFTADLSHELRTPLTIMRGETEVALRSPRSPREYQQTLESILEETQWMTRVIDQLLLLARADSGELRLETAPVPLRDLLADLYEQALVLARPKQIEVTFSCAKALCVCGDELRLRQLFLNLLDNAVKYTPPGGRIWLEAWEEGSSQVEPPLCVVEVRDTGVGIAEEDLPHVFERFFRADRARGRSSVGGSGLGLSICHWIVTAHGGTIELKSRPGAGSCFRVRLPGVRVGEGTLISR